MKEGETKPKLTDQEITGGSDFRSIKSRLNPPKQSPNGLEKRKLVGILLGWLVKFVMNNFLYTFGGKDRKQTDGAPIGDILSQAAARMVGNEFDDIFLKMLETLEIKNELYDRYVDDIQTMTRSIGRRTRFCPMTGTMVEKTEEEIVADLEKNEDEITMEELRKVADTC